GTLSFYAASAGREAAALLTFELVGPPPVIVPPPISGEPGVTVPGPGVTIVLVAQLGGISGTALDLIATLVTMTVTTGSLEGELEASGGGTALLAVFAPGGLGGFGQGLRPGGSDESGTTGAPEEAKEPDTSGDAGRRPPSALAERLAPWA